MSKHTTYLLTRDREKCRRDTYELWPVRVRRDLRQDASGNWALRDVSMHDSGVPGHIKATRPVLIPPGGGPLECVLSVKGET